MTSSPYCVGTTHTFTLTQHIWVLVTQPWEKKIWKWHEYQIYTWDSGLLPGTHLMVHLWCTDSKKYVRMEKRVASNSSFPYWSSDFFFIKVIKKIICMTNIFLVNLQYKHSPLKHCVAGLKRNCKHKLYRKYCTYCIVVCLYMHVPLRGGA